MINDKNNNTIIFILIIILIIIVILSVISISTTLLVPKIGTKDDQISGMFETNIIQRNDIETGLFKQKKLITFGGKDKTKGEKKKGGNTSIFDEKTRTLTTFQNDTQLFVTAIKEIINRKIPTKSLEKYYIVLKPDQDNRGFFNMLTKLRINSWFNKKYTYNLIPKHNNDIHLTLLTINTTPILIEKIKEIIKKYQDDILNKSNEYFEFIPQELIALPKKESKYIAVKMIDKDKKLTSFKGKIFGEIYNIIDNNYTNITAGISDSSDTPPNSMKLNYQALRYYSNDKEILNVRHNEVEGSDTDKNYHITINNFDKDHQKLPDDINEKLTEFILNKTQQKKIWKFNQCKLEILSSNIKPPSQIKQFSETKPLTEIKPILSTIKSKFPLLPIKKAGQFKLSPGINNYGNTCFANSAFQLLYRIEELTNFLIIDKINNQYKPESYSIKLINDILIKLKDQQYINDTKPICSILESYRNASASQQDSGEFIRKILDRLKIQCFKEDTDLNLNKIEDKKLCPTISYDDDEGKIQTRKEVKFKFPQYDPRNFIYHENPPISDIKQYDLNFNFLVKNKIEEIKNIKNPSDKLKNIQIKSGDKDETNNILELIKRTNRINVDNQIRFDKYTLIYLDRLYIDPNTGTKTKYNKNFNYGEKKSGKYIINKDGKDYKLIGFTSHSGDSGGGHYIAGINYISRDGNEKWKGYSDASDYDITEDPPWNNYCPTVLLYREDEDTLFPTFDPNKIPNKLEDYLEEI